MNKMVLLLVICSLFTAFNCSTGSGNKTNSINIAELNPYFPAALGSKWLYIKEAPNEETELFTVEVKELNQHSDGYSIKVSSFPFMTTDNTERNLKITNNGEVTINDYNGSAGVFIPSSVNFTSNYKWQFGIYNCSVNNEPLEIKTPAGIYSGCKYIYMTDGFTFSFEMWYKKGIGIVKWGANRTNPPILKPVYYVIKEADLKN